MKLTEMTGAKVGWMKAAEGSSANGTGLETKPGEVVNDWAKSAIERATVMDVEMTGT